MDLFVNVNLLLNDDLGFKFFDNDNFNWWCFLANYLFPQNIAKSKLLSKNNFFSGHVILLTVEILKGFHLQNINSQNLM